MSPNCVAIGLRIAQIVCLIIAAVLVAVGDKRCTWMVNSRNSTEHRKECSNLHSININEWPNYEDTGSMAGQYFVFCVCIIFILVSLILCIAECVRNRILKLVVYAICIFCGLVLLIATIVEIYYAVGSALSFSSPLLGPVSWATVSWVAACVFLCFASILYFVDAALTFSANRRSYAPNKQQPSKQPV